MLKRHQFGRRKNNKYEHGFKEFTHVTSEYFLEVEMCNL